MHTRLYFFFYHVTPDKTFLLWVKVICKWYYLELHKEQCQSNLSRYFFSMSSFLLQTYSPLPRDTFSSFSLLFQNVVTGLSLLLLLIYNLSVLFCVVCKNNFNIIFFQSIPNNLWQFKSYKACTLSPNKSVLSES